MKFVSQTLSRAIRLAKAPVRWLGYRIAWNHPRLYLHLVVRWKLQRSAYYRLVKDCKVSQVEQPPVTRFAPSTASELPRRILFLIHWYELGGAESYALYTIRTAQELGHHCYCISTVPSENRERSSFESWCVEALAYPDFGADAKFERFIIDYIRTRAIDLVHIHHSTLTYEALPAIRKATPNLVVVDSTHIVEHGNGGFPQLSARYSRFIDRHNVISKNLIRVQRALFEQEFGSPLPLEQFHLTYLSGLAKVNAIRPRDPNNPRKVVTFYGRLVLQKQPNVFVATMERLMAQHPELEVEAHIYGDGEMRTGLEARIAHSRFKDRLLYFGRCDDQKAVLETTDILILTSLNEGLSLTTFEALSCRRLVVSSDVGAQGELLCEECLVPLTPLFIEQAASRLGLFLTDRQRYFDALAKSRRNLEEIRPHEVNREKLEYLYGQLRPRRFAPSSSPSNDSKSWR